MQFSFGELKDASFVEEIFTEELEKIKSIKKTFQNRFERIKKMCLDWIEQKEDAIQRHLGLDQLLRNTQQKSKEIINLQNV